MWNCIKRKEDFTERGLVVLHKYTATFMHQWVDLCAGKHMTNYIHVQGAGHLTYAAKNYGNLYRFLQQGWESLNKLIKHYYYNNTNHRGSYGNGGKDENGL
jgi:threonyl-tRNA synthetase